MAIIVCKAGFFMVVGLCNSFHGCCENWQILRRELSFVWPYHYLSSLILLKYYLGYSKSFQNGKYIYTFKISFVYLKPLITSFNTCFLHLNINCEFTTCTHKLKWCFCFEKTVLNKVLKLVDIKNQMRINFSSVKSLKTNFKA